MPESELPDKIDWEAIADLAHKHAVQGIIIESTEYLPENIYPPKGIRRQMSQFALGLIQANIVVDATVARLTSFFKSHGVNGVLLKGQGVARYYPKSKMRHNGDVDFYVGRTVYKKAVSLCQKHLIKDKKTCHETSQHYDFAIDKIPIEIHRLATRVYSPWRNKRFQHWIVDQLEHSPSRRSLVLEDVEVAIPSYDFDVIYIFYHAWRHFITGGIGLRQLCDWVMILHTHRHDIDADKLVDNIKRFGMTNGWKLFGCIAVNHLGLPAEEMPLYDPAFSKRSEKMLDEILAGGNFGFYTEAYADIPTSRFSLSYTFRKFRNAAGYLFSLFPLMPAEATFLFFHRIYWGFVSVAKRALKKE